MLAQAGARRALINRDACPRRHDVGGLESGCAERVTDLPSSTFAFVLIPRVAVRDLPAA